LNNFLWFESHADAYMNKLRSTEEIYESLCNRIRQSYAGDGEQLTEKEIREVAENLLGLCNNIVEIEMNKDE
jgi:hypothetical protein